MNQPIFIIILIAILIVFYIWRINENFQNQNTGIYNYFYEQVMNPYPYPMNKFFNNDILTII